ncbi:MAG: non-homologous end-joining DNA ligase [Dehalococcoidia bacterium]|nr:non-homologous end-joining DNA ligase [Dehalococcoidia bacterium]
MTHTTNAPAPRPDGALPDVVSPMLAVPVAEPFDSPDHIFEPAWDGMRALAFIEGGRLRLQGRNLAAPTGEWPEMEALPKLVSGDGVVLDGEIVALDALGRSSFTRLQDRLRRQTREGPERAARRIPATYMAFDILYWAHRSLLTEPLMRRRDVLQQVARTEGPLRVAEFVESAGVSFFQVVEQLGLEGMVAKHKDGIYLPGRRSPYWLRVRVARSGIFVIGGYTFGGGNRRQPFLSLLLGLYDGDRLVYAGSVSGGFSDAARKETYERLVPLHTDVCPFASPPVSIHQFIYWCGPELVCQVKYGEMAPDKRVRFPLFVALRPDISPHDCAPEDVTAPPLEG